MNKKRTDKTLKKIRIALKTINEEIASAYTTDRSLYKLMEDVIFDPLSMEFYDDHCWRLKAAQEATEELQEILSTHNDEILPPNISQTENLQNLGYRNMDPWNFYFEKILEENEEREVVDEIQIVDGKPLRRERTIEWEKTDNRHSSKTIKYKQLPISKKLSKAIEVSLIEHNSSYETKD